MLGKTLIRRIQKQFPQVTKVKDATSPVRVSVTKKDNDATKKNPNDCALARACRRSLQADGAIINISTSYLIKDDTAIRYKTSVAVAREITSFDRGGGFEEGKDYLLSVFEPSRQLGVRTDSRGKTGPHISKKGPDKKIHRHYTENIRVSNLKSN